MQQRRRFIPRAAWPGCGILVVLLFWMLAPGGLAAAVPDLATLSQDPFAYLEKGTADLPLLPPAEQARLQAEADLLYFAPWHRTEPHHPPELASWGFREFAGAPGYGAGGRPHPKEWLRKMAANARIEDLPQRLFPAVTVNPTSFRLLPTLDSHSRQPRGPSPDNPFDNLQASTVPAGMPLMVMLVSRDREWVLAETSHLLGWLPAADVAAVDDQFIRGWQNGRYAAIIRDKAPVTDGKRVLFPAPLGAIYPLTGDDGESATIWTAGRDARGNAFLRKALVAKEAVTALPLPFTPGNVARLARELAGEPYGWGGLYGRRDCSALVRDIFAPFGIWLPRNSGDQAVAWKFIGLRNLPATEKEALILRQGVPWRTLLWTPGHIMLYIGAKNGKPLVFHSFWSVKTRDGGGNPAKVVVGRAAVTTLQPAGRLASRGGQNGGYLAGLEGMTLLGEPPDEGTARQEAKP